MGAVLATNSPTSWSIIAGNPAGDFAINDTGVVTFTSRGAAHYDGTVALKSATLTVQATNTSGAATATVEVNAYADGSVNAPSGPDLTDFLDQRDRDYCIGMISSRW